MQNKANFNQRVTREERRKNAKQTQFKDLHWAEGEIPARRETQFPIQHLSDYSAPRVTTRLSSSKSGHGARVTIKYAKRTQFTKKSVISAFATWTYKNISNQLCWFPQIINHH
jgi:hypothetical protein